MSKHEKVRKVLVLDAGEAPYSLTIARSLGSAGYDITLGFPIGAHVFHGFSKYCKKCTFYPDPSYALKDFLSFIKSITYEYDCIIPAMEKTQLAISLIKDFLENKKVLVPIPNYETLRKAVDKVNILDIASNLKIPVPRTIIAVNEKELIDAINKIGYPFIMKVSTEINIPPGPGNRYFVVENKSKSFKDIILKFKLLRRYGSVIIQQYIKGVGVGVSFMFSKSHKLIAVFGHRRVLEQFKEGGPSVIAETYYNIDAIKLGYKLLRALNWQGVAMVEFKLGQNGELYFMELNPRFWGTLPLAIASGVDFPRLLVENYDSSVWNRPVYAKRKVVFIKVGDLLHLLIKLPEEKRFLGITKSIFKALLQIARCRKLLLFELERTDLRPAIKQLFHVISRHFSRNKMSKVNKIFFGPQLSYRKIFSKIDVNAIIDLREHEEILKNKINVPLKKITYINFPIKDDLAPNLRDFLKLIDIIDKLHKNGPLYIHCRVGRGRAPMVTIAYLISKGVSIEYAYLAVYKARPYTYVNFLQRRAIYNIYNFTRRRYMENRS